MTTYHLRRKLPAVFGSHAPFEGFDDHIRKGDVVGESLRAVVNRGSGLLAKKLVVS